jgi:hypothetical protein
MIDKFINVSVIGHLVVFGTIVENKLPMSVFLGLSEITNCRKNVQELFEKLFVAIKDWGLNLRKCVDFDSNGVPT